MQRRAARRTRKRFFPLTYMLQCRMKNGARGFLSFSTMREVGAEVRSCPPTMQKTEIDGAGLCRCHATWPCVVLVGWESGCGRRLRWSGVQ